jgi:hypothetical protein
LFKEIGAAFYLGKSVDQCQHIIHGLTSASQPCPWSCSICPPNFEGIGMGCLLGTIAFVASGYSYAFGLTVMIAQFISIVTAGCTGTFAPLIFTFIFERDSGKWGGPLETAVQDIVGSFAMVVISYQILEWFGPFEIDPSDTCGTADLE